MDNSHFADERALERLIEIHPDARYEILKQSLLRSTTGLVRQRRRFRRLVLLGLMAACFLAGTRTGLVFQAPPRPVLTGGTSPGTIPSAPPSPDGIRYLAAEDLERLGEIAHREEQAVLYRRAGDRYLETDDDVQSAFRCYRQSLDAGTDQHLEISANEDSWLLMAVKAARQKERQNGKQVD